MINRELKEELKEKKNLIALSLFFIIMFIFMMLQAHSSIGTSIGTALIFVFIIVILFKSIKWILWIFLKPTNKEKITKRTKLTDRIASILIGSLMFLLIVSQFLVYGMRSKNNTNFKFTTTHSSKMDYKIETTKNIHSDLNSCESLRTRFQSCVSRSYRGLECFPGTDIVLPERCKY